MCFSTINSVIFVFGAIVVTSMICNYITDLEKIEKDLKKKRDNFNTIHYVNELLTPPFSFFPNKSDYILLLRVKNNLSYWQKLSDEYGLYNDLKKRIEKWMHHYY